VSAGSDRQTGAPEYVTVSFVNRATEKRVKPPLLFGTLQRARGADNLTVAATELMLPEAQNKEVRPGAVVSAEFETSPRGI
jgi:hypothetical protein